MAFNQIVAQENKYTNNQLRELYQFKKNREINDYIDTLYDYIYQNVIHNAMEGINEYHFTIELNSDLSYALLVPKYDIDNYINIRMVIGSMRREIISMYNINLIDLIPKLFDKIKDTFPEINLEKWKNIIDKNDPRDYYTLSW
jgi:hypothetical protein